MTARRSTRSTALAGAAAAALSLDQGPEDRAAEQPVASKPAYPLRKRSRGSTGLSETEDQDNHVRSPERRRRRGGKTAMKGRVTNGKKASRQDCDRVLRGKKIPHPSDDPQLPPPQHRFSLPGLVAAAAAAAEAEDHKDDDDSDLSSLTSLSDLEPDPVSAPVTERTSPRPCNAPVSEPAAVSEDDDEGSVYVDGDDRQDIPTPTRSARTELARRTVRKRARRSKRSFELVLSLPSGSKARGPKTRGQSSRTTPRLRPKTTAHGTHNRSPTVSNQQTLCSAVDAAHNGSQPSVPLPPPPATPIHSNFEPSAMPTVLGLYEKRSRILDQARMEATSDIMLQRTSEDSVEAALAALETSSQQSTLCLAMNRLSAWCAQDDVQIPVFPLTGSKVALFLARCTATPTASLLLSTYPQPRVFPLPVANCLDPNLTPDEGNRLTRELVKCWIDALGYAQLATRELWTRVFAPSPRASAAGPSEKSHASLRPLHEDDALREVLAALEPADHMQRHEARGSPQSSRGVASVQAPLHVGAGQEEMRPPHGKGKGKGKARATATERDGGEATFGTPVVDASAGAYSGEKDTRKTKWVKGGKMVAPPNPSLRASSASSGGSQPHLLRTGTWTSASPFEQAAANQHVASNHHITHNSDSATLHISNQRNSIDRNPSSADDSLSLAQRLLLHTEFPAAQARAANSPFQHRLFNAHRRSSTTDLLLDPGLGPVAPSLGDPGVSAGSMPAFLTNPEASLRSEFEPRPMRSNVDNLGRTRSVTHDARLEANFARGEQQYDPTRPYLDEQHSYAPISQVGGQWMPARWDQPRSFQPQQEHRRPSGQAYVIVHGQRYELAPGPPPPGARLSIAPGTAYYTEDARLPASTNLAIGSRPGSSCWLDGWSRAPSYAARAPAGRIGRDDLPSRWATERPDHGDVMHAPLTRTIAAHEHTAPLWTNAHVPRLSMSLSLPPPSTSRTSTMPFCGLDTALAMPELPMLREEHVAAPPSGFASSWSEIEPVLPDPTSPTMIGPSSPKHMTATNEAISGTDSLAADRERAEIGALLQDAQAAGAPGAYPTPESPSAILAGWELPGSDLAASVPMLCPGIVVHGGSPNADEARESASGTGVPLPAAGTSGECGLGSDLLGVGLGPDLSIV